MRIAVGFLALVLVLGGVAAGCRSTEKKAITAPEMAIRDYRVIWTRGGKLGYLKTYDVSDKGGPHATIHWVEDLDFRQRGWVADDGQAARYDYPPSRQGEALRTGFETATLPVDSLENQIRKILQVDPLTEIALQRATEADLRAAPPAAPPK